MSSKGLSGRLGDGRGNWRLELWTALDIEPSAYAQVAGGFLTAMHAVARTASQRPGRNCAPRSDIQPRQRAFAAELAAGGEPIGEAGDRRR